MFITKPIKTFNLNGNKLTVNESVIEYEDISKDTQEILESLISKGAYGSALLTLNMFHNVVTINESDYTQEDYISYLSECNRLMEECVIETEARNFRPLINLNGLEIMENADHIARGKGNKILIEDFRMTEEEHYTGTSRADEIIFEFQETDKSIEAFTKALNELSRMKYDNEISKDKYDECIKQLQEIFKDKEEIVTEECEGTQCSDIAEKKDQNVGQLQKPKKIKHIVKEALSVPKNHGFKGFRLNEQKMYVRGNYVLINENGKIRAVNKKLLESNTITQYTYGMPEYEKLEKVAEIVNKYMIDNEIEAGFNVKDTYFDAGQDWKWTTIICDSPHVILGSYQCLSPAQHERIILNDEYEQVAQEIINSFMKSYKK